MYYVRNPNISYFARTDFRNINNLFGIYQSDRLLGMYLLGKTGSGKTNLLKTLLYQDIHKNRQASINSFQYFRDFPKTLGRTVVGTKTGIHPT